MFSKFAFALAFLVAIPGAAFAQGGPGPAPAEMDGPRRQGVETWWLKDASGNYAGAVAVKSEDVGVSWSPPEGYTVTNAPPDVIGKREIANENRAHRNLPPIEPTSPRRIRAFTREVPGDKSTPVVPAGPSAFLCGGDPDFPANANGVTPCPGKEDLGPNQFYASAKADGGIERGADRRKAECEAKNATLPPDEQEDCSTPLERKNLKARIEALEQNLGR